MINAASTSSQSAARPGRPATTSAPARLGGWLVLATLLFAAGLAAAHMQWLAGRAGLWLEMALILFAAYGVGCCLGALIRRAARKTA